MDGQARHVAIDGTKIKANASDAQTYDIRRIDKEIERWMEQPAATDHLETRYSGEMIHKI